MLRLLLLEARHVYRRARAALDDHGSRGFGGGGLRNPDHWHRALANRYLRGSLTLEHRTFRPGVWQSSASCSSGYLRIFATQEASADSVFGQAKAEASASLSDEHSRVRVMSLTLHIRLLRRGCAPDRPSYCGDYPLSIGLGWSRSIQPRPFLFSLPSLATYLGFLAFRPPPLREPSGDGVPVRIGVSIYFVAIAAVGVANLTDSVRLSPPRPQFPDRWTSVPSSRLRSVK